MKNKLSGAPLLVVGAGIMGVGIAQVAAQAGHAVMLYDTREGAAAEAKNTLASTRGGLVSKGKLSLAAVVQTLSRIETINSLDQAASVQLVVEAIVEKLDVKRGLFKQLEAIVEPDCVLASNTSSISVTAIANGLTYPGRLLGMHFFNPVPLMKLVEVVSGLQTDPAVAAAIVELSVVWGKVPVHARSTPGFIVNRIARPYYAETLALLQEQASTPAVLDGCLRAAGFRMGPCELMDLIGHDTNFSVTQSVYEANFFDKRYQPSLVQRELVDGGLLGRKSGQGFYSYAAGAAKPAIAAAQPSPMPIAKTLWLHGRGPLADALHAACERAVERERLPDAGPAPALLRDENSDWIGLEINACQLRMTDGRCASQLGADVAVFDLPLQTTQDTVLAWAPSSRASAGWTAQAQQWLQALGFNPQRVADTPGLVVARSIAMLINEAADAVHQGVCNEAAADAAMKLGVNYPAGPFEWLALWGAVPVCQLLDALDAFYRGERYRASPMLRQQTWKD